jgi:hypothetical protein
VTHGFECVSENDVTSLQMIVHLDCAPSSLGDIAFLYACVCWVTSGNNINVLL